MQKIPNLPYRTYLNKYKQMTVSELVNARKELEPKLIEAVKTHTEKQFNGTSDEEYEAWIISRNLNAELETLNGILNIKRIEEDK